MLQSSRFSAVRTSALVAGLAVAAALAAVAPGGASFHLMQIEQAIGGVCGDVTQQAIQLRMRSSGQNLVVNSRLRVWDGAGANPIVLLDITQNVANGAAGARVLLASAMFAAAQSVAPDFTLVNVIPASYLPAGSLTFEADNGDVLWRLSWGGDGYTGSGAGGTDNDVDGDFSPAFAGPLVWTTLQAVRFSGLASAASTNNAADYLLTPAAATFTNNAAVPGTVVPASCIFGDRFETGGATAWTP